MEEHEREATFSTITFTPCWTGPPNSLRLLFVMHFVTATGKETFYDSTLLSLPLFSIHSILFLFLFFLYPTLSQPLHSILPIYAAVLGGRSPCLHAHHTSIVHLNQTPSLRKHFPPGQASNRHKGGAEVPAAFGCSTESLLTQPHQPTPPQGLNTVCQTPR